ncbi:flavin reductase family protein [Cognatishimia sp. WU-CL00825]|uniref:flavin reductase family protein n=1 Tax=Cognatishimia sp. WU-CL00825 TaxID=3127658 RepID=UPI003104127A
MFYRPDHGHGLPHNPFKAIVAPRPIAWISTQNQSGISNLAPYSFFNAVADDPPQIVFGSNGTKSDQIRGKDTLANIRETGVFCVNIVSEALKDAMNKTSFAHEKDVDEFEVAGLSPVPCQTIDCDRVFESPANLECKVSQIIELEGKANFLTIATVTGVHLKDDFITKGLFELGLFKPLSRLGYRDYAIVQEPFSIAPPRP